MNASIIDGLQIAGWALTVLGQVQVTHRLRSGFATWMAANLALIAVCMQAGLYWSIGMYATNLMVCAWSFHRWGRGLAARPPFVRSSRGSA